MFKEAAYGGAVILAAFAAWSGALLPVENQLSEQRFAAIDRPATGDLAVIAIDGRSLEEIGVWPWPRHVHAELIDRLFTAGASEIAFDVDFSARSTESADRALEKALSDPRGAVMLPAFLREKEAGDTPALSVSRPLERFRKHVWEGSVSVQTDAHGTLRRASYGFRHDGVLYPSLHVLLAGMPGTADEKFYIDFGVEAGTIPVYSVIDVLEGRLPEAMLRGKRALVGGTAIELGDHFSVPRYSVLPGVMTQVLAYESLVQDRALARQPRTLTVGLILALGLMLILLLKRTSWPVGLAMLAGAAVAVEGAAYGVQAAFPVLPATAPLLALILSLGAIRAFSALHAQGRQLLIDRLELHNRKVMLDRIVDDSSDGIVVLDHDVNLVAVNAAARAMFDLDEEDVRPGRPAERTLPAKRLREETAQGAPLDLRAFIDRAAASKKPEQLHLLPRDGEPVALEITATASSLDVALGALRKGHERRMVYTLMVRDVTERRKLEEAQARAREEAEAASRAKSEFLANMSHELRTPLNAVIGFSDVILKEFDGPLGSPKYAEYIKDINESGTHLLDIVNDILDVARVEAGTMTLNEDIASVSGIIDSCVRIAAGWEAMRPKRLTTDVSVTPDDIFVDERLIKQAIINLLSNAAKFTDEGGSIHLEARRERSGALAISVKDDGIGVAKEEIPNLTKPFYQTDSRLERAHEGSGLGLALVAAHMKAHGGRIAIDSAPGKGTQVTLTLPAERFAEPSEEGSGQALAC